MAVMAKPKGIITVVDLGKINLDREPQRHSGITRRLGRRLSYALKRVPEDQVPDEEWLQTYKIYSTAVLHMMAEQRQRVQLLAAHGGDGSDMTEEQVEAELRKIAIDHIRGLPEKQRRELLASIEAGKISVIDVEPGK